MKYLFARIERLESEGNAEDFLGPEVDVLNPLEHDIIGDFYKIEVLPSAPNVSVVPIFDDYLEEEQHSPAPQFSNQRSSPPAYDSHESDC